MVFSSLVFLCVFFPLQMLVYYLAKGIEARNTVLILFSLVFYAWGEPFYIVLLLFMAVVRAELPGGHNEFPCIILGHINESL